MVPVFNAAATLDETVPSWLEQDFEAEWWLVDDGSTDDTADRLEALVEGHPAFHVLRHSENRGRAAARNTGIAAAGGDVLLFLDADMRPTQGFVRAHAAVQADEGIVGVLSRAVLEGLDPSDPYHCYLRSRERHPWASGAPIPFKHFIIGYTSVKAAAVRAVGGLDERFTYGEDIDFAYRLARYAPGQLVYSDEPVVHHYDHGTLEDRLRKLEEFGRDNLPLLLGKHPEIATVAQLDFVPSPEFTPSLEGRLKRWAVQSNVADLGHRLLPHLPRSWTPHVVRYILATRVATAFHDASSISIP